MPWYFPWPDYIKKKACRYLLQHYVGSFQEEKLTLDQLSVDLYSGTGTVKDVKLDVWALNELLESVAAPVEMRDGTVGSISVEIPWSALLTANSKVEIKGLKLTFQPKYRLNTEASGSATSSMMDSMWTSMSMTSSMQLAQECLKRDSSETDPDLASPSSSSSSSSSQPFEGPELLAQMIESVLTRVEMTLIDTIIRLEHVPQGCQSGIALELHIERLRFFDEGAHSGPQDQGSSVDASRVPHFQPAAVAHKNFQMMGVTVHCEEFPEDQRHTVVRAPSVDVHRRDPPDAFPSLAHSPEMPPQHTQIDQGGDGAGEDLRVGGGSGRGGGLELLGSCIVGECAGKQEVKVRVKQHEHIAGPKAEVETYLGSINLFLSPRQVHLLLELFSGFLSPDVTSTRGSQPNKPMQPEDFQRIESELQEQLSRDRLQRQEERLRRESWGLKEDEEEQGCGDMFTMQSLMDDDDLFFSMTGSLMSMSHTGTLDDMETSFTSTVSSSSTDTSRTGSSLPRVVYGNTIYRGPSLTSFGTPVPKTTQPKRSRSKKGLREQLDDPTAELTRYKLRFSSLSLTVLHNDPARTPLNNTSPAGGSRTAQGADRGRASGQDALQERSEDFFRVLGKQGYGKKDQGEWKERFARACPYDHLRLTAAPVTLDCDRKSAPNVTAVTADLSFGLLELYECLFDRPRNSSSGSFGHGRFADDLPSCQHIEVLSFKEEDSVANEYVAVKPSLGIRLKSIQRSSSQGSQRRIIHKPKSEVSVDLGHLSCEFDVTIVDRLYTLLHPQSVGLAKASVGNGAYRSLYGGVVNLNKQAVFNQALEDTPSGLDQFLDIRVSCPVAHVAFRFPIPDLRELSDCVWWKRSLREEILHLELQEMEFRTMLGDGKPYQTLLLQCRELQSSLQIGPLESPISFLRVKDGNGDINSTDRDFDWPKLVVKLYPESEKSVFEDVGDRSASPPVNSWEGACHFEKPEVSPFSSKWVMYDSEKMVMPGDQEEMREFSEKAIGSARIVVDLVAPSVNILLPSKDFVELLYNRFGYDVLLWQPAAPTPRDCNDGYPSVGLPRLDLAGHLAGMSMQERFTMCQSGLYVDSDSDPEEDSSGFYTTLRQKSAHQVQSGNSQSFLALNLTINHGKLTMCTPLKESPFHGDTMLEIEDGSLFTVTDYKGCANLSYLCLQANRIALYHNGRVDSPLQTGPLPHATWAPPDHLQCCIYLSDGGVPSKLGGSVGNGAGSSNMVALAMKMFFNTETNIKNIECAVGVRGATLRHYMSKPEHSWLVQLSDFFDVVDEEVLGYDMPSVVTEFHAHFWGCGIDYRPLNLPLRTYVMAETLSISSNLVYEAKESLLRFLVDDAAVFLSDRCNERSVDIRNNYVCVLDLGMLEVALRMSTVKDKNPKIDLKVSNNIVHLRTCADSCTALARLILYLASDGDHSPPQHSPAQQQWGDHQKLPTEQTDVDDEEPFVINGQPVSDSPIGRGNHLDQMQQLMDEAMRDVRSGMSPPPGEGSPINIACTLKRDGDLFLFPNEDQANEEDAVLEASPHHHRSLNGLPQPVSGHFEMTAEDEAEDGFFNDEEFCVLDDPGMGVLRTQGEPEVQCLEDTPIAIQEDHFARPLGRGDQLNAPAHFPTAVMKYTLQEMTVVWHIYGGNDFGPASPRKLSVPDVPSSSPARPSTPDRSRTMPSNTSSPASRKTKERQQQLSWYERGGPGRDHSTLMELQMNKVRFQHSQYPDEAQQRSRQILLISDIEVRDRLANSQINKFMYLYSSEARPRRTHANMVLVKALHIRPDPNLAAEECCLRISLQPLRLNVDQDSLFFLHDFFNKVSADAGRVPIPETKEHLHHYATSPTKAHTTSVATPVDTPISRPQSLSPASIEHWLADGMEEEDEDLYDGRGFEGNSLGGSDQTDPEHEPLSEAHNAPSLVATETNAQGAGAPIFFRSFVFSPDVPIKLDYEGKRVDMEQGTLMGLLMGLGQLNHSELTLKRLHNRHGLLGIDKLILYAINEWANDIKKTQLPSLLGGVGPMHSLVQLVQGMVDLVRLPVEQYRKDGRLMRGFQRGASSFGTSTAMAAVELTNRMVRLLQAAAETAYDMVSPGPSVSSRAITYGPFGQSRLARQPADFREGMANAFNVVREGLEDAALAMVQAAREEHQHKGVSGAVGGILRQIPPTVIKPLILASEATSSVLGGVRNQMRPDARKEDSEKWRSERNK
ncbi:autophagy-related protein 2 homolog B-like isoform X2 [Acanthaster planci]|uniref:Autophagy-related protein 2 n=1 Tax=Acanthaster planci TaxID=133434 RepID=A0A8B7Z7Y2_ACAPL|nr:autophagy-related protein 2 homolog B-like isoform X2 [Acanthaster planci]